MNQITAYTGAEIEPARREISENLFNDFIAYIDRSPATARTYKYNLRPFFRWMVENQIKQPVRDDILLYRQYLTDKGLKANTIVSYLGAVRVFFSWTGAKNLYPNVFQNIHPPKVDHSQHKKDALTVQEVRTIEESIESRSADKIEAAAAAEKDTAGRTQRATEQGKRLYAMYLLAVNAGLRTIEISRANIKDLETRDGNTWLYIWGKGRSEADQKKALAPEVMNAIQDYLNARTDNYTGASPLFVSTGNRSGGQRIAATTIGQMLKKAMKSAGFDSDRLTAHSLRHTAGTAVQELTGDIYQTQKYMRHRNPATTEIYIHDSETTQRQEVETAQRLYFLYHGKSEPDQLQSVLQTLTPAQLQQITSIASMMAGNSAAMVY